MKIDEPGRGRRRWRDTTPMDTQHIAVEQSPPAAPLITVEEAAVFVGGISGATVRREIRDGRLRAARVRGRLLIDRVDLAAWIETCKRPVA